MNFYLLTHKMLLTIGSSWGWWLIRKIGIQSLLYSRWILCLQCKDIRVRIQILVGEWGHWAWPPRAVIRKSTFSSITGSKLQWCVWFFDLRCIGNSSWGCYSLTTRWLDLLAIRNPEVYVGYSMFIVGIGLHQERIYLPRWMRSSPMMIMRIKFISPWPW